jgi:DNA-binding MarR family transcriptional regulator
VPTERAAERRVGHARHRTQRKHEPDVRKIKLDGLTDHLGYLTRRAQIWIFQDFMRTLGPLKIRPAQYSVLTVINANPGLRQVALAHALGIERARLVHVLDGLERRGFVKRSTSATDRRSHALHLTPAGQVAFAKIKALAFEHENSMAQRLGPKERKQLLRLLRRFAWG